MPGTEPGRVAAIAAACLLGLVALFQVLLVLGAPWGDFTQGGATSGALGTGGRLVAALSAVLLLLMAGAVLGRAGMGPLRAAPPWLVSGLAWFTAAYSAIGIVLNLASRSEKERLLWTPVTAVLFVLVLFVLLRTRKPR